MNGGPLFQKTYTRPPDRWPFENVEIPKVPKKFIGLYYGKFWYINHKLHTTDLVTDLWLDVSTPGITYKTVKQIDDSNIIVEWEDLARGKAVIYSLGNYSETSLVWEQTTSSNIWTVPHSFGTDNLVLDIWVNKQKIDPITTAVDPFNVIIEFNESCEGKVCIMVADPNRLDKLKISYLNLLDVPSVFPPEPHIHTDPDEVKLAYDSLRLEGFAASYFLNTTMLGVTVCPLNDIGKIPFAFMPDTSNIMVEDSGGRIIATKIEIDDTATPLFLKKSTPANVSTAIVSMQPVTRYIQLIGKPGTVELPTNSDNILRSSYRWDMRLSTGYGIRFKKVDQNTVQISSSIVPPKVFKKVTPLNSDQEWIIHDSIFKIPGKQLINLYESITIGSTLNTESKHVIGYNDIDLAFTKVSGPHFLHLDDGTLKTSIKYTADHFFTEEINVTDKFLAMNEFYNVCYNSYTNTFVTIYKNMSSNKWIFYTLDPVTGSATQISALNIEADIPFIDLRDNRVYGLKQSTSNEIILVRVPLSDIASGTFEWEEVTTLGGSMMPNIPPNNLKIIFRVQHQHIFIYEEQFNKLTVYDMNLPTVANSVLANLPTLCSSFDVWDDDYCSFCHKNPSSSKLIVSTTAATNSNIAFKISTEEYSGNSAYIAIGENTAITIKSNGNWVYSKKIHRTSKIVYFTGETVYWLQPDVRWKTPLEHASIFDIDWKSLDLSGFNDVRIAFVLDRDPNLLPTTMPNTLKIWDGTEFIEINSANIGSQGNHLDVIKSISLIGGDILGYALYVKKSDMFTKGHIDNNFTYKYKLASMVAPVPMSGIGAGDCVKVSIFPNKFILKNTRGLSIKELTLIVQPIENEV